MTEKLLHYIWKFGYFNTSDLQLRSGEPLGIIHPGDLNTNQGPDFLDARIRIGDTIFAGSIELHIRTSDWKKHGHESDANYSNVILHVVFIDDDAMHSLPLLELQSRISSLMLHRYNSLMNEGTFIPCSANISEAGSLVWISWKERMVVERLVRKALFIKSLYESSGSNWEETIWWMIARNFGGKVNAEAFEELARSLPFRILLWHRGSIHQLEALLLGQAGMLIHQYDDSYLKILQREYLFLANKYRLEPIKQKVQFLRMRPGSFPSVRLAQLAMLIHTASDCWKYISEDLSLDLLRNKLDVTANDYWHYHYKPGELSEFRPKHLGEVMINNLLVNTVIPLLFAFGAYRQDKITRERAIEWLMQLEAEDNNITTQFHELNVRSESAFDSQALTELKNEYCNCKRCLECAIGNAILKKDEPVTAIEPSQQSP